MTDQRVDRPVARGLRRLFEPLQIGNFTVRNRIVNPIHGTTLSDARDIRYIQERARGGVGLMGLSGASFGVHTYAVGPAPVAAVPEWDQRPLPPTTPEGIAHYDDFVIPHLRRRAEVVHAEGAKCFAQVFHLGVSPHGQRIHPPVGPSHITDPYDALSPHPLTEAEIEELVFAFAQGIRRVAESSVDAAEIHAAHGYLAHQFLSPYFNRRTDKWGGERANRVRFVLEIIAEARKLIGDDFPIGVRVGVDGDGLERGITVEELAEIGHVIGPHVAYISVSGGSYSGFGDGFERAYVSPWYERPGFNVPAAAALKAKVEVPVLVTGRIADPYVAEGILADGAADLVGMVRALIADPELPNKARRGEVERIRMCLGMSECHYIGPHRTPVTCAVNASAGREDELEMLPVAVKKTVVVVGAGPAGLEAARVAATRGHDVFLADAGRTIGGTVGLLALDPNRRNLRDHAAFFEGELKRLGVQLMLGNVVTADELVEFAPDAVVVATGSRPLVPEVEGITDANVVHALDVLRGAATVGPRVLVVGGLDNHIGAGTIAEYLADQGRSVELITEQLDFAHGAEDGTRMPLVHRLMTKGVTISMCHKLVKVHDAGATVQQTFTGATRALADVTVVLACGAVANDSLARELNGRIPEVYVIGDALAPRRIVHATLEGARVGLAI